MAIQGEELAVACAKAADDIKADNVRVLDMRGVSNLTDYMVICSGSSMPQLRAILRDVAGKVSEDHGRTPRKYLGKMTLQANWLMFAGIFRCAAGSHVG